MTKDRGTSSGGMGESEGDREMGMKRRVAALALGCDRRVYTTGPIVQADEPREDERRR